MKYWHPHLPFGQHISVSTLVMYEYKGIADTEKKYYGKKIQNLVKDLDIN